MISLKKPARVRLHRSARALVRGNEILDAVLSMEDQIVAAAESDIPPVSAISDALLDKFGADLKAVTVRQFIGTVVKAMLADSGFEVAQTGVRLPRDKVFTTGAAYRRAANVEGNDDKLLRCAFANMVRGMSQREREIMFDELRRVLGSTDDS